MEAQEQKRPDSNDEALRGAKSEGVGSKSWNESNRPKRGVH